MAPFYDHLLMCLAYELFYANRSLEQRTEVLRSLFSGSGHIWRIKKKKKTELFASVSLAESSFVGVCGPADGSLQLSGPNRRRKPQTLGIHSELIPLQIVRNRGCFSVRYKVMSVRTV